MSTQRPNVDSVLGNTSLQRNNIYPLITQTASWKGLNVDSVLGNTLGTYTINFE